VVLRTQLGVTVRNDNFYGERKMCINRTSLAAFLLLMATLFSISAQAEGGRGVVIQVTDEQKLNMALTNAINTSKVMPGVELEVVVYGPAITSLKMDTSAAGKIDDAKQHGVKVVACEESMQGKHLTKSDMYLGLDYVPFGLAEIVTKQFGGWAYARP